MLVPPLCWSCGSAARRGEPLCRGCRLLLHRLAREPLTLCGVRVWAPVAYAGPARDLVRALMFARATRVADAMAAEIAANAPSGFLTREGASISCSVLDRGPYRDPKQDASAGTPPPVLIPVPLHPRRLRARGFNQAAVIARALGARTGLEAADCLLRSGSAATQVGRHRAARRSGPAGTVELRSPAPRSAALLVDDVVTTGATLAACAAALAAGGCPEIAGVTFARTIGR